MRLLCLPVRARSSRIGFNFFRDVLLTENPASAFQIVRGAQQAQVFSRGRPAEREGHTVLEGEKAPLAAAMTLAVDECALRAVSLPHGALDLERHVA